MDAQIDTTLALPDQHAPGDATSTEVAPTEGAVSLVTTPHDIQPLVFQDMLSKRLGFAPEKQPGNLPGSHGLSSAKVSAILCCRDPRDYHISLSEDHRRRIGFFVGCFVQSPALRGIDKRVLMNRLSDLGGGLGNKRRAAESNQLIRWTSCASDRGRLYVLSPKDMRSLQIGDFMPSVDDPAAVAHTIRSGVTASAEETLMLFLRTGTPFSTWTLSNLSKLPVVSPSLERNDHGLGIRQTTWKPVPDDYKSYEGARNELLASSRGRAALMRGGITWRLSKEHVAEVSVTQGVSGDTDNYAYRQINGDIFLDDNLEDWELNLISGVYVWLERTCHCPLCRSMEILIQYGW